MAVDDREVLVERAHPVGERLPDPRAELARAELRHRLGDLHRIRAAEEREEVVRVVGEERQPARFGVAAGQDRGHRLGRVLVDGGGVPEPRRVACKPGEVRVADAVDLAVLVHQGRDRQLIEHDEHDRRAGSHRRHAPRLRLALELELVQRRVDEEEGGEDERRGGEHGQEGSDALTRRVRRGEGDPGGSGEREREPCRRVARPDHDLERDERRQPGDEHQVKRLLRARVDQPSDDLGEDQEERRPEQEPQRQHNQVERGRPAHDEELRRVTQQVVERLGDGEGREDEQVDAAGRVAAEVLEPRAHVDGKVVSARREPRRGRRA